MYSNLKRFTKTIIETKFLLAAWSLTLVSLLLRVWRLNEPKKPSFDERYYPLQGYSILHWGYEKQTLNQYGANKPIDPVGNSFAEGHRDVFLNSSYFSSHPYLGKILMGIGEFFGSGPLYWRIPVAIAGSLSVFFLILITKKLLHNNYYALFAGFILSLDPITLSVNRLGLLDSFIEFFIILSVYLWTRYDGHIFTKKPSYKILFLISITLGLACSVKWSGAYYLAGFLLYSFLQLLFYNQGYKKIIEWLKTSLIFISLLLTSFLVYLASWLPWMFSDGGYMRDYFVRHPESARFSYLPHPLRELLIFHLDILNFHKEFTRTDDVPSTWRWFLFPGPMMTPLDKDNKGFTEGGFYLSPIIYTVGLAVITVFSFLVIRKLLKRLKIDWSLESPWLISAVLVALGYLPWLFTPRVSYMFYGVIFAPYAAILVSYGFKRFVEWKDWFSGALVVWIGALLCQLIYWAPFWAYIYFPYKYSGIYYWIFTE